ncbi:TIGR02677 family protein [Fusibacter sp. 3D3]|uniref:TIGR02677 family protein n=1 Tax=Fusibacter sp. 3D3 TaxID=1048380 RepID=UPI000853B8A1|nr:TIGR02677 family protein [Fusibacter sp. 3D3]GAU77733.1 hypothetical protein F3D3_2362 [Fusibacter sp. 3D3]
MQLKSLKPILETRYLSVENAWRYRAIMRIFYINDQRYRHWMNKEDVFKALREIETFETYTMDMCTQDLEALHQWGNLNAVQDTSKVMTYQQFVNKQFRYQMTEYAIEIERMSVRIENLFIEGGSLEPTLMERLKSQIKQLPQMLNEESMTVGGWWSGLVSDFQRLNQSYQDYIRDWSGAKAEELLKTKHFLIYKEKLVDYLRHFIKALQQHGHEISIFLKTIAQEDKERLYNHVTDYEMEVPRVDMEALHRNDVYANIRGKYMSLEAFFLGEQQRESELQIIMTMTNEIIRRVTRYAATILEQSNQYSGRKEEYKTLATIFSKMEEIDTAHHFASQVFGVARYRHFVGDYTRQTENIQSSIYDEGPMTQVLSPRVRTYREKIKKTAIIDRTQEKMQKREEILKAREIEKEILLSYTASGIIEMEKLGFVQSTVRRSLLKWIQKGISQINEVVMTEHGQKFSVLNPGEKKLCTLESEDGIMTLPAYILKFEAD